jgi:glycogen phosphorylase
MPDFNVKNGQRLYPAADLSEQISMAGKEASGTGNMKFSMNGALTIGTLDGANVEIRDEVGHDNFFLFGMTAPEVQQRQAEGYRPWEIYHGNHALKSAVDLIASGLFSHGDTELFRPLTDNLIHSDPFMVLADFQSYVDCQREVDRAYRAPHHWDRMSILNTARMGKFSSDRSIQDYVDKIWLTPRRPPLLGGRLGAPVFVRRSDHPGARVSAQAGASAHGPERDGLSVARGCSRAGRRGKIAAVI